MSDPYRPQMPPPDPELARLAMQGQQRRAQLAQGRQFEQAHDGTRHLRTAIGAYRGSTLKRILLAFIVLGLVSAALGGALSAAGHVEIGGYFFPGFGLSFVMFMIWVFVPPYASKSAVAAEQDWAMALPFQLQGYFELLGSQPRFARTLVYEIVWRDGVPPLDPAMLHGAFCAVDPGARLDRADGVGAQLTSGSVSGGTNIRVNNVPVYRNHRLPAHVHSVVDQVLVLLHRSHPISRVSLRG